MDIIMKLSEKLIDLKNDCLYGHGLDHDQLDDAFNRCIEDAERHESKAETGSISGVTQSNRRVLSKSIYTDHNVPSLMEKYLNEIGDNFLCLDTSNPKKIFIYYFG